MVPFKKISIKGSGKRFLYRVAIWGSIRIRFKVSSRGLLGGPFDLVSRVSKVGYGGL